MARRRVHKHTKPHGRTDPSSRYKYIGETKPFKPSEKAQFGIYSMDLLRDYKLYQQSRKKKK